MIIWVDAVNGYLASNCLPCSKIGNVTDRQATILISDAMATTDQRDAEHARLNDESMTTVRLLHERNLRSVRAAGKMLGAIGMLFCAAAWLRAEEPAVHWQHAGALPPGAIGRLRLGRGGPVSGFFQLVSIAGPKGAEVSLVIDRQFSEPEALPVSVGMLIAPVYRLRITNIPFHPGTEVFPTVEVIDRLYPPPGQAERFPVPVVFSLDELELAIEGKYVTRVIYVENPLEALAASEADETQHWFEAKPGEDPLAVADRLGRPVAIVRIGGRLPAAEGPGDLFLGGSPPLKRGTPHKVRAPHKVPTK